MSGLKYFTIEDAQKLKQKNHFRDVEDTKVIDPIDECKYEHKSEISYEKNILYNLRLIEA